LKESQFQLIGKPKLNRFEYQTNKNFTFSKELQLELNSQITIARNTEKESHKASVLLKTEIFGEKQLSEVPFQFNMEIEGFFQWNDELAADEQLLDSLLNQNAPAILYSYLRPLITLITVEADMPPLVIPLMNFKK
jgi:preprotein translocase subunit SecB